MTSDRQLAQPTQDYHRQMAESEAVYQQAMSKALADYQAMLNDVTAKANAVTRSGGLAAVPCGYPLWREWAVAHAGDSPSFVRFGQLTESGQWHRLTQPALLPLIGHRDALFKARSAAKSAAVRSIQPLLLRLLATLPPGKLRFTFIDPIVDEQLIDGKAWTEPQHIEVRLADLTEHVENVIQKYLRNQFATIEDYNAQAGEVAEPYRVLVVFDFPANFSEAAARRPVSIAQNGPRCGVFAVILADTDKPLPHGFTLADLEQACTVIAWDGNRFVWQDPDFKDCRLEPGLAPGGGSKPCPQLVTVVTRHGRRRELPGIIADLAAEVNRRLDGETPSPSQGEGWGRGLYLVIYGLQRARDLRQDDTLGFSSFSEEPAAPNPAQQFATILREGPDVDVHTIVWCDTLTNLNRNLDRRSLREFALRVVLQMSAEDSANLVDTPAASKLGPHRALFYNEDEGRLEKFRPYGVPSAQWLAWAGEQWRNKGAGQGG
ncbi:MAG: hypothetical protein CVU38_12185 [Chloroflexi bacterium HGW-Chloroflexi-1]|nr:MAG: hypothetical protein CVU38_12185 [Chloroflexi bacterium HGW-Chloroflexi-1]